MTTFPTDPPRADAPDPGDVAAVRASGGRPATPRIGPWPGVLLLAPAALIAALAFWSGGFFPDLTAVAAMAALLALLVRVVLAPGAFARPTLAAGVALAAFAGFAAWTLASSIWSDAPARALLEYDRTLLYGALLAIFVSLGRTEGRARALVAATALGCAVVGIAALGPWLLPETFPIAAEFGRGRLNWPTSYWNATGLIAALGVVLCAHLASSVRDHAAVRVLGAAAVPPLVAAVVFSVSRGAAAAGLIAAVVYLVLGRSRGMLTGLPVVLVFGGLAAARALGIEGLDAAVPTADALDTGRETAVLLAVLAVAAAAARGLLLLVDARLSRWRAPRLAPWPARALGAGVVVALVVAGLAAGGVDRVRDGWDDFSSAGVVGNTAQPGQRLTELGNNGRIEIWDVALQGGFEQRPWIGVGAGTYPLLWERDRPSYRNVFDGHSVYLETLGEMGIVGMALLGIALVVMLGALWWRALRDRAPAWGALAAVATAWAVHAGVDWDWEMPAVTAWVFCAGGLALARPAAGMARRAAPGPIGRPLGILAGVGCLVLALVPLSILRSQEPLIEAQRSFRAGDCTRTIDRSVASNSALSVRPEPLELIAWCDVRLGRYPLAVDAAAGAVRRDPRSWEPRYTQALVLAAAGQDPRPAARAALARNPLHPYAQDAVQRFTIENRRQWRQLALEAKLPLGGGP